MKIYATSDVHGNLDGLDPTAAGADVAVFAGDLAPTYGFGRWHVHRQRDWMDRAFARFVARHPSVQFVLVPGNHDLFAQTHEVEALDLPDNAHLLVDASVRIGGLLFYGTPWVPRISGRWAFEARDASVERAAFDLIPDGVDVLVAHTPPRVDGSAIDTSEGRFDVLTGEPMRFGSAALADAIRRVRPRVVFCGHIHTGDHAPLSVRHADGGDETRVYNVSRVDEAYEIAYAPAVVDLDPAPRG